MHLWVSGIRSLVPEIFVFQTIKYERKSPRLLSCVIIPLGEDRGNIQGNVSTARCAFLGH